MNKFDYSCLEHLFSPKSYAYELEAYVYNIIDILKKNVESFSDLKSKQYYYFKMPKCDHLQLTSLKNLKEHYLNNTLEDLSCHICNKLSHTLISYEEFKSFYSRHNTLPLHEITKTRKIPLNLTCLECYSDTPYDELRWLLENFKQNKDFKFCRNKCCSIAKKYPKIIEWWSQLNNNKSPFDIIASDENMSHKKFWFECPICYKANAFTPYNVLINSPRCPAHKNSNISFEEAAVYLSFKRFMEDISFLKFYHRFKFEGNKEFDIYIEFNENNKFALEIDGNHHKDLIEQDESKNQHANRNNVSLVRIRSQQLSEITLAGKVEIIQHKSNLKAEINHVIRILLLKFKYWVSSLKLSKEEKDVLSISIQVEIDDVDVIRDELIIYKMINLELKKLLKDDPNLQPIWKQLHPVFQESHAHIITSSEQNIERPFICTECRYEWYATVNSVVQNFKKTNEGSNGCPACANKVKSINQQKILEAMEYRKLGYTQKEIAEIFNRSQPTISEWGLDDLIKDSQNQINVNP